MGGSFKASAVSHIGEFNYASFLSYYLACVDVCACCSFVVPDKDLTLGCALQYLVVFILNLMVSVIPTQLLGLLCRGWRQGKLSLASVAFILLTFSPTSTCKLKLMTNVVNILLFSSIFLYYIFNHRSVHQGAHSQIWLLEPWERLVADDSFEPKIETPTKPIVTSSIPVANYSIRNAVTGSYMSYIAGARGYVLPRRRSCVQSFFFVPMTHLVSITSEMSSIPSEVPPPSIQAILR